MTKFCVPITPLVIGSSETIVSKNTPKMIPMTKHAQELFVSKDTKVNPNMEVIAKDTLDIDAVN